MLGLFGKKKSDPKEELRAVLGECELPTFPAVVANVLQRVRDDEASSSEISDLVSSDPGLSVRLLGTVNSAAFALRHRVRAGAACGLLLLPFVALALPAVSVPVLPATTVAPIEVARLPAADPVRSLPAAEAWHPLVALAEPDEEVVPKPDEGAPSAAGATRSAGRPADPSGASSIWSSPGKPPSRTSAVAVGIVSNRPGPATWPPWPRGGARCGSEYCAQAQGVSNTRDGEIGGETHPPDLEQYTTVIPCGQVSIRHRYLLAKLSCPSVSHSILNRARVSFP